MSATPGVRLRDVNLNDAVKRVVVAEEARQHPGTDRILGRLGEHDIPREKSLPDREGESINKRFRAEKQTLYIRLNRGSFIKPWESPASIVGRDEWCLTPVEGCPLDCSYCYLQDYLDRPLIQVFANQSEMADHVRKFMQDPPEEPPLFFSLGELSDGLFLEPVMKSVPRIWDVFRDEEAKIEIRSKSHHVHDLARQLNPHPSGVFTWTLSPSGFDQRNEMLTSPLEDRLAAMRHMLDAGFRVSARIDPILLEDGWLDRYAGLVKKMDRNFDLGDLTFILLGVFRFPKGFDRTMEKRFSNRDFLRDEFVEGPDGKLRYPRGRRTDVYRQLGDLVRDYGGDPTLCMEPDYVWEDAGFR